MRFLTISLLPALGAVLTGNAGASGPWAPGPGFPGSDAIPAASERFVAWANGVAAFQPGPTQAGLTSETAAYGTAGSVTGPADAAGSGYDMAATAAPVLSLGDGGSVTLLFPRPVTDGEGPDFAVFENGFSLGGFAGFSELAFVEVSSNGTDFVRFPAVSCTPTDVQAGMFGTLDPTGLHNLAGKHPAGYGTPFDLAELAGAPSLDISSITHVRITDVVGDVSGAHGSRDSLGNWINDPFPTNFQTGGFDLDAVGVMHQTGETWDRWHSSTFPADVRDDPAIAGPDADPDRDGRPNLLEYACGSDPQIPNAAAPLTIAPAEGGVVLSWLRQSARTDVAISLEQSADGGGWIGVLPGETLASSESGMPLTEVSVTLPVSGRRWFRLTAVRQ